MSKIKSEMCRSCHISYVWGENVYELPCNGSFHSRTQNWGKEGGDKHCGRRLLLYELWVPEKKGIQYALFWKMRNFQCLSGFQALSKRRKSIFWPFFYIFLQKRSKFCFLLRFLCTCAVVVLERCRHEQIAKRRYKFLYFADTNITICEIRRF